MSRVITFSRYFPAYHPRKGEPTYFVEQIYNGFYSKNNLMDYPNGLDVNDFVKGIKHHTIRAGNRWKVGDKFSPRVWSGKPYNSKQIIIAPDIEIKKVWSVTIDLVDQYERIYWVDDNGNENHIDETEIAKNDGLTSNDFYDWFDTPENRKQVFSGQIICWNENIIY